MGSTIIAGGKEDILNAIVTRLRLVKANHEEDLIGIWLFVWFVASVLGIIIGVIIHVVALIAYLTQSASWAGFYSWMNGATGWVIGIVALCTALYLVLGERDLTLIFTLPLIIAASCTGFYARFQIAGVHSVVDTPPLLFLIPLVYLVLFITSALIMYLLNK